MVVLNRIYTRTGDDGTSGLGSGERRVKSDPRFEAIGTVDETNAHIGLARAVLPARESAIGAMLERIQNDLFDLGADLARPEKPGEASGTTLRVSEDQVRRLEAETDELNARLEPLRSFVLPGGSEAAAALHLARTVARRAERVMVAMDKVHRDPVSGPALRYINRLSDLLFVAARAVNDQGRADTLWVPGANR